MVQLKVSLRGIEPPIWRRILVAQDVPLPRLHSIIQMVMGWDNSHLHQFKVGKTCYGEPALDGAVDYSHIPLNKILPRKGATCVYEYDFGDGWEHLIKLEDRVPAKTVTSPIPRCLAGEGACPPEDCGGPSGYETFLAVLGDPSHEEHEDIVEWVGDDFDPEAFDLDRVNRHLSRLVTRSR